MEIKLGFKEAQEWKAIVQALSALVSEVSFLVSDEGLSARAIDEAHIAMVDLNVPLNSFQEFTCEQDTMFAVYITEMLPMLRRISGDEYLELSIDTEKNKVHMKIDSEHSTKKFTLSPLERTEGESIPLPEKIIFTSSFIIEGSAVKDAIKDAEIVGDYIVLKTTPDTLKVVAEGDVSDVEIVVEKEAEAIHMFDIQQEDATIFALKYLSDMTKDAGSEDKLYIQYATDMPLKMERGLPGKGKVTYFLAPRIEGDEPSKEAEKPEEEPEVEETPEAPESAEEEPEEETESEEATNEKEAQPESEEEFTCEDCGRSFKTKRGLAIHSRVHEKEEE